VTAVLLRKLADLLKDAATGFVANDLCHVTNARLLEKVCPMSLNSGRADGQQFRNVARLSEQVEALRAQANIRRTLMLFAMYRTLTREQRIAFSQLLRQTAATRSVSPPRPESPLRQD
jgi:hypothetical protein